MKKLTTGFVGMLLMAVFLIFGSDSKGAVIKKSNPKACIELTKVAQSSVTDVKLALTIFDSFAEASDHRIVFRPGFETVSNVVSKNPFRVYDIAHIRASWYINKAA